MQFSKARILKPRGPGLPSLLCHCQYLALSPSAAHGHGEVQPDCGTGPQCPRLHGGGGQAGEEQMSSSMQSAPNSAGHVCFLLSFPEWNWSLRLSFSSVFYKKVQEDFSYNWFIPNAPNQHEDYLQVSLPDRIFQDFHLWTRVPVRRNSGIGRILLLPAIVQGNRHPFSQYCKLASSMEKKKKTFIALN